MSHHPQDYSVAQRVLDHVNRHEFTSITLQHDLSHVFVEEIFMRLMEGLSEDERDQVLRDQSSDSAEDLAGIFDNAKARIGLFSGDIHDNLRCFEAGEAKIMSVIGVRVASLPVQSEKNASRFSQVIQRFIFPKSNAVIAENDAILHEWLRKGLGNEQACAAMARLQGEFVKFEHAIRELLDADDIDEQAVREQIRTMQGHIEQAISDVHTYTGQANLPFRSMIQGLHLWDAIKNNQPLLQRQLDMNNNPFWFYHEDSDLFWVHDEWGYTNEDELFRLLLVIHRQLKASSADKMHHVHTDNRLMKQIAQETGVREADIVSKINNLDYFVAQSMRHEKFALALSQIAGLAGETIEVYDIDHFVKGEAELAFDLRDDDFNREELAFFHKCALFVEAKLEEAARKAAIDNGGNYTIYPRDSSMSLQDLDALPWQMVAGVLDELAQQPFFIEFRGKFQAGMRQEVGARMEWLGANGTAGVPGDLGDVRHQAERLDGQQAGF